MAESDRRLRFGLPSLLLVPLWVSPLFLSTIFIRQEFEQNQRSAKLAFNMLACTAAYAAFFTARSRRRVYREGHIGPRHVLPAAWSGALFGLLFMAQVVVPWGLAGYIARALRHKMPLVDSLLLDLGVALKVAAEMFGMLGAFGLFLGAFGGSLVGLVFDWQHSHACARPFTERAAESPSGDG